MQETTARTSAAHIISKWFEGNCPQLHKTFRLSNAETGCQKGNNGFSECHASASCWQNLNWNLTGQQFRNMCFCCSSSNVMHSPVKKVCLLILSKIHLAQLRNRVDVVECVQGPLRVNIQCSQSSQSKWPQE